MLPKIYLKKVFNLFGQHKKNTYLCKNLKHYQNEKVFIIGYNSLRFFGFIVC